MGQVTLRLNGYVYTVGCKDGQESHLQAMAQQVERRIERVRGLGGQAGGEARTLVLATLLMADEIHDLTAEKMPDGSAELLARAERVLREETRRADRVNHLAERAEGIATQLERH